MNRQNARIAQYGDLTDTEIMEEFVDRYVVTGIVRNEGSIVLFSALPIGKVGSENLVTFAADRRPAIDICAALACGEDVEVELEGWQIVGRG